MIINIIIFSLWVWAIEGNLHLSGRGIAAQLFINKKKTKLRLTLLASGNTGSIPYPLGVLYSRRI